MDSADLKDSVCVTSEDSLNSAVMFSISTLGIPAMTYPKKRRILNNTSTNHVAIGALPNAKNDKMATALDEYTKYRQNTIEQISDRIQKFVENPTLLRTKILEVLDICDPFQDIDLLKQHSSNPSISTPEVIKEFIAVCVYNNMPSPILDLIKILKLSDKCNQELEKLLSERFYDNNYNEIAPQNAINASNKSGNDYDDIENVSIDSEDSVKSDTSYDSFFNVPKARKVSDQLYLHKETFVFETDCPCKSKSGRQSYEHQLMCKCFYENQSAEM